jgi:hypothetical protein
MTPQEQADLDRLKEACQKLGEHYDSVHIFATRHESGALNGTVNAQWGQGNWFARYGQIQAWLIKQDEGSRSEYRRDNED